MAESHDPIPARLSAMPPDSAGTCESQVRTPARTVSAAGSVKGTGERHQNEAVTATASSKRPATSRTATSTDDASQTPVSYRSELCTPPPHAQQAFNACTFVALHVELAFFAHHA